MTIYTYEYLEKNGRLGNQIWQIAAMIGQASRNSTSVARFKPDWEYKPYFSVPDTFFKPIAPYERERHNNIVDGGTEYFQELHYFDHIVDEVRQWFSPSPDAFEYLTTDERFDQFWKYVPIEHSCSVHIRRGDYLKTPHHFPIPSAEYYRKAMEIVSEDEPDTHFMVFSDDIEWCKQNLPNGENIHYMEGSVIRPVEVVDRVEPPQDQWDLFLMTECDRHIIANSTFSWWGAWLSGDDSVIYPSRWFGDHPAVRDIPWRLMIPESWIEVEA